MIIFTQLLLFSSLLLPLICMISAAQEESILGVYIFHRHGDRTAKILPPTRLTNLGYQELWQSGNFYRNRYILSHASSPILHISPDIAQPTQLNIQAPVDTLLQTSALAFLQALYPPVGPTLGTVQIRNLTKVEAPLNGYQLVPVQDVSSPVTGSNAEGSIWLQGASACNNAILSSNEYFFSTPYLTTLAATGDFYRSLLPVINTTFTNTTATFKNAYSIYDYIHVAEINNLTIPASNLLTPEALFQLQTLADQHEFALAYNASQPIRAIQGSTLAAQIVQQLNSSISSRSTSPSLSMQFGTYATFFSFFGLAGLPAVSGNFTGIVDYASSMAFEVFTNSTLVTSGSYPGVEDIHVRFLLANGTAAANPLKVYPLFGTTAESLPWTDFVKGMNAFAIGDQQSWCAACGNSTGRCAAAAPSASGTPGRTTNEGGGDTSRVVAGVIGAMVTLAAILGLEALVMLLGGIRLIRKSKSRSDAVSGRGRDVETK